MTAGVIVAGGRSIRFGGLEKTVVELDGTPLIKHVADRLGSVTDELVVNCRADQRDVIASALDGTDPRFAIDEIPDRGPTAGIATGLAAVDDEYAVVVACDMPFLDPDLLAYLLDRVQPHDAAVPKPDEWFEPLHAAYRAEPMAAACERALDRGEDRIVAPVFDVDYEIVGREELLANGRLESFESIDTPDALALAAERFN